MQLNIYPNPANSEVQISLSIPEKQKINISAYSIEGKLIKTLADGLIDEGMHRYSFGKGMLPGTYLVNINSSLEKIVRKVILLD